MTGNKYSSNAQLRDNIRANSEAFIKALVDLLQTDPDSYPSEVFEKDMLRYLPKLIDKDGSVSLGLLIAVEHYLEV